MTRRGIVWLLAAGFVLGGLARSASTAEPVKRPNILWISAEDFSPDMGCYGDTYAVTPNMDRLAAQGVRFTRAFSNSPVCAPSRSALITGTYCTTSGTHQMRCQGVPAPEVKCFPEYLRAAGYYCTNNVKTDYQFEPPFTAWDESSARAHWRNRKPGQPFFAVFNFTISHESQVRNDSPQMRRQLESLGKDRHDPAKAVLPPYYPDTPKVRKDWAQYYDVATLMDRQAGEILKQLEEDGLAEDTIVWFWGDHGRGLTRGKRWVYDSGTRVPLIVRVPEKLRSTVLPSNPDGLKPGTVNEEMTAFVDFAPTMLSLAGLKVPAHMPGRRFLGAQVDPPRPYVFANRDRMDEAYDCIRTVRDRRFRYVRNFMAHLPYSQDIDYMNQMPTLQEMRRLNAEGKLEGPQRLFFRPAKPVEELYDTEADPHEVNDLAPDPKYAQVLSRLRAALEEWMKATGDIGLLPEPELDQLKRPGGVYERTAAPVVSVVDEGGKSRVTLASPTPGASVGYRIGAGGRAWQLYTGPLTLEPGQELRTKACRIGFRESGEVSYTGGSPAPAAGPAPAARPHWRQQVEDSGVLASVRQIKRLDGRGEQAVPEYLRGLKHPEASVRYWAVVGLHTARKASVPAPDIRTAVEERLADPSVTVRIAAAHALCDWGGEAKALPVLAAALKDPVDSARLHAIIALRRIGPKAGPALPAVRACRNDSFEYVKRVTEYVLTGLGE